MTNIEVSIICISYNHEKFISQAIESFLSQEVDFEIEIIIADDCSVDETRSIIEGYHREHSGKIVPILHNKNIQ